jgi:uncharacterized membrane protein
MIGPRFGAGVRALLVVVGLLPFVPRAFEGLVVLGGVGEVIDSWFAFQCHREAGRSLGVLGELLPVCTRCAGIYFGLGLGAAVLKPRLSAWPLRIWVAGAALVMVLDVATELLGIRPPSLSFRLLTGIALSYPVGLALVLAARGSATQPA